MFHEAAQLNGYTLEEVLAAAAPAPEGIRTPRTRRGLSEDLSPIDGLEALFSEVEPSEAERPKGQVAAAASGDELPSPLLESPQATGGEEDSPSDDDVDSQLPKQVAPPVPQAAQGQPTQQKGPAQKGLLARTLEKQPSGRAQAGPKVEISQATPKPGATVPTSAVPEAAGSSGAEAMGEVRDDTQASRDKAEEKLAVANSVTHPREYRQFLRAIQQRHLPDGVEAALKAKGKQTLFQEFLAADCSITSVAAVMKKEVEKACAPGGARAATEPAVCICASASLQAAPQVS
jgi:hypothetical protein